MVKKYKLADCGFLVDGDIPMLSEYISEDACKVYSKITVYPYNQLPDIFGVERVNKTAEKMLRDATFGELLLSNNDWNKVDIYSVKNPNPYQAMLLAAIYSRLCFENVLLCHSSLVDCNGHGILFVGPSGIGKTTQAKLWQKYRNATIINGDKAFIRLEDEFLTGYGLPWKGSCGYNVNRSVKIDAIVVLQQDKINSIEKLSIEGMFRKLVSCVFLPYWDEECMKSALETFDKVLNAVPAFLLKCRPDEDAVRLTETTILG